MAYFLKILHELIQYMAAMRTSQASDAFLEYDYTRLLSIQAAVDLASSESLSDSDLAFFIDLGLRYDAALTIDQQIVPLCVAWVELSAQMGALYDDWRFANALVQRASQLRAAQRAPHLLRVAVFGSGFNPTTLGHVDFIRLLLQQSPNEFASICVIPSGQSPLKSELEYASVTQRLQILDLVLTSQLEAQERARVRVDTLEVVRQSPSWMVMTLSALILMHHAQECYVLACGYDHLLLMQQWYHWQDLAGLCELWFYPRQGIEIVNDTALDACLTLCQAGICVTLVFAELTQKQAFEALYRVRMPEKSMSLELIYDPNATIRATSATDIRKYYQKTDLQSFEPPAGISLEAHHYILAHHCYRVS